MHAAASKNQMLSNDALRKIDREIAKYPADQKQSAVMAALAIAQEEKGWLSGETMEAVASYLGMPPIAVYEVATFYNMYDLQPVGRHKLTVCTNLPCALSGGVHAADYRRRPLHPEGRRVHGRLRRRAGDAGEQPAHVQLDDPRADRQAARRVEVR
jgi:NADH:ubiquinone oxidoreductase subunit E